MFRQAAIIFLISAIIVFQPINVAAEQGVFIVNMITEKGKKLFLPDYIEVSVGDTVRFVNVSGNHNTESMRSMIPEGAARWKSNIGKQFDLSITHECVYAYRCTPHYRQAMVGLIVAGNPHTNLDKAKQVYTIPKAANVFDKLFARAAKKGDEVTPSGDQLR